MNSLSNKGIQKLVDSFAFFTSAKGITIVSITIWGNKTIDIHSHYILFTPLADMDFQYFLQEFFDPEDLKQNEKVVEEFIESI